MTKCPQIFVLLIYRKKFVGTQKRVRNSHGTSHRCSSYRGSTVVRVVEPVTWILYGMFSRYFTGHRFIQERQKNWKLNWRRQLRLWQSYVLSVSYISLSVSLCLSLSLSFYTNAYPCNQTCRCIKSLTWRYIRIAFTYTKQRVNIYVARKLGIFGPTW